MNRREAVEILTPVGGGVSQAEAEKTRAMLADYMKWKDAKRRQLTQQLALALFEPETSTPH